MNCSVLGFTEYTILSILNMYTTRYSVSSLQCFKPSPKCSLETFNLHCAAWHIHLTTVFLQINRNIPLSKPEECKSSVMCRSRNTELIKCIHFSVEIQSVWFQSHPSGTLGALYVIVYKRICWHFVLELKELTALNAINSSLNLNHFWLANFKE